MHHSHKLAAQRAVVVTVVHSVFGKLSSVDPPLEFFDREKRVRDAVHLSRPRCPRRRRHRVTAIRTLAHKAPRDAGLAATGWRRKHDDHRSHSRFSSCSRHLPRVRPSIPTTSCAIATSFAFAPIVLTSRPSSCARKPSCFPTACSRPSASRAREMGPEPHQFLGDIEPVSRDCQFGHQPCLVEVSLVEQLPNIRRQPIALAHQPHRRLLGDPTRRSLHCGEPVGEFSPEDCPFPLPRRAAFSGRRRNNRCQDRPGHLGRITMTPQPEHISLTRHQFDGDLATESELRLQRPERGDDCLGPPGIDRGDGSRIVRPADLNIHMPALELAPQRLPKLHFQTEKLVRKAGPQVEEPVVDRPDFHPDPSPASLTLRRPESRHAQRQSWDSGRRIAMKDSRPEFSWRIPTGCRKSAPRPGLDSPGRTRCGWP